MTVESSDFFELRALLRKVKTKSDYRKARCVGKQRFESYIKARGPQNNRTKGRDVYRCEDCAGWHVGRPDNNIRRAR